MGFPDQRGIFKKLKFLGYKCNYLKNLTATLTEHLFIFSNKIAIDVEVTEYSLIKYKLSNGIRERTFEF